MTIGQVRKILTFFIVMVWMVNGLFCKVLNLVPRHEQIVARILSDDYSGILVKIIGFAEIGMVIWILSGIKTRLNVITQIVVVGIMNVIEFIFVPDLLLLGRMNIIFAWLFMMMIHYNEFILNQD